MRTRQRITMAQTQRLQLNLGLTTALRILAQDAQGLTRFLEEQVAENPHLALEPAQVVPGEWLPRWADALARAGRQSGPDFATGAESVATATPSLIAHVMAEVDRLALSMAERRIALALVEALEPTGWLGLPLAAVAQAAQVAPAVAEAVLARLQQIEPRGLFARSLAECLRLQAQEAGILDPVLSCILEHLDLLAAGDFARLARMCAVGEHEITARLRLIRRLDPKPGAQFADGAAAPIREPDLIATKGKSGWDIALNRSALPSLRVERPEKRPATPEARALLGQAQALGRMLESRNATVMRVGRAILQRQEAALEHGLGRLQPMTMAEIAETLGLHESTISRVVAGTSVDTPRGTWWLRSLFSARLGEGDTATSAAALRAALARLVAAEPPGAPLPDAALAEALAAEGHVVARRTLAKYRAQLHIPPAHRRRARPA